MNPFSRFAAAVRPQPPRSTVAETSTFRGVSATESSEHARLTAGTADLWRQLVDAPWGRP